MPEPSEVLVLSLADEVELEIEKLVAGGDGLGRSGGVPVFVPLSAPGDRLRVRIVERKPHYGRAEILEILEPGPDRRTPPCPHFESCGGCSLQHLDDAAQLAWKVRAAREALTRLGKLEINVPERILSAEAWHYRLRAQLRLDGEPGAARVGYFARGSHDLVPVRCCPVLAEPLEDFVTNLPKQLDERVPSRLDVALGDDGSLSCGPALPGLPTGEVRREIGEFVYGFDARCFFQTHSGLLNELVEVVVGGEEGGEAYDLYAGVGLFSLPLARRYRSVTAVESDRLAVRYLRKNARMASLTNLGVQSSVVESWIEALPDGPDRVVVDPPRAGLSLKVRAAVRRARPARLTYVSCHPAALARDVGALVGDFTLESLAYLDLFPQTGHIEIVAQLRAAS